MVNLVDTSNNNPIIKLYSNNFLRDNTYFIPNIKEDPSKNPSNKLSVFPSEENKKQHARVIITVQNRAYNKVCSSREHQPLIHTNFQSKNKFVIQPGRNAPSGASQSTKKKKFILMIITILHAVGSKTILKIQKRLGNVQDTYLFWNKNLIFKKMWTYKNNHFETTSND